MYDHARIIYLTFKKANWQKGEYNVPSL